LHTTPPLWRFGAISALLMAERRRVFNHCVANGQRMWLRGNAVVEYSFCAPSLLDANPSRGHVDVR
jgi:hypothetical protein